MTRAPAHMIASSKASQQAQERWDLIVERFRSACILHKKSETRESKVIIKHELPILIKAWIQILPASLRQDAKADLGDMFEREQALVDHSSKMQQVFKETLVKRIIPELEARIAAKYRNLYINKSDRKRAQLDDEDFARSWISPAFSKEAGSQGIAIDNVSDMIDALHDSETEELANSLVDLDDIVGTISKEDVGSLLSELTQ